MTENRIEPVLEEKIKADAPFKVDIISTGSDGNCVIIDDVIMIDIGLTQKKQGVPNQPFIDALNRVEKLFITHKHGDHLNIASLKYLMNNRPALVQNGLYCNAETNEHIKNKLKPTGSRPQKLFFEVNPLLMTKDRRKFMLTAGGHDYEVFCFHLPHGAPGERGAAENQGFVFKKDGRYLIYATDTETMDFAPKMKYDVIVIEGNYDIDKIINDWTTMADHEHARAVENFRHLSIHAFEDFVNQYGHADTITYQLHESNTFGIKSRYGSNNIIESLNSDQ